MTFEAAEPGKPGSACVMCPVGVPCIDAVFIVAEVYGRLFNTEPDTGAGRASGCTALGAAGCSGPLAEVPSVIAFEWYKPEALFKVFSVSSFGGLFEKAWLFRHPNLDASF